MYGFLSVQIMFGSEKLSKKNTPEPFNRVLEAIFDPWQGFKIFFLKISSIFWKFSKIFKVIFSFTNNHLDGSARLKYWKKYWPQSCLGFGVKIWLFLMGFFGVFWQFSATLTNFGVSQILMVASDRYNNISLP